MALVPAIYGCQYSSQEGDTWQSHQKNRKGRITANRHFLEKERASIQAYIVKYQLEMQRSGTGLYYRLFKDSVASKNATSGDRVEIEYRISSMSGTGFYSSKESGPRSFTIDCDEAEIGLHEAIKLLGVGDKGLFILPSHLAFGVAGDQQRIPPAIPLVYEIEIINIQQSKS